MVDCVTQPTIRSLQNEEEVTDHDLAGDLLAALTAKRVEQALTGALRAARQGAVRCTIPNAPNRTDLAVAPDDGLDGVEDDVGHSSLQSWDLSRRQRL